MKKITLSHPQHAILGLGQVIVGLILIFNDYYFFWPPFLVSLLNDDLIGGCGVIFGLWLIKWAFSDKSSITVNRNLLFFSAFFWGFEMTAEYTHGVVSGNPHMFTAGTMALIIFLFTLSIITKSKKHKFAASK